MNTMSPSQEHTIALAQAITIAKETAVKANRLSNRNWGLNYLNHLYRNNTPLREAAVKAFGEHLKALKPTHTTQTNT
jgi:hypothetical protein